MPEVIKTGMINVVVGIVAGVCAVLITTGSYKHKVDINTKAVCSHEKRLNVNENNITGLKHDVIGNQKLLSEMRSDIKELLRRSE